MDPKDEEKTAFITDDETYCHIRMPYGLQNTGSTYQKVIDHAFEDQIGRNIKVYVNDIIVKSKEEQDLIRDIAEVFAQLRKYGFGSIRTNACSRYNKVSFSSSWFRERHQRKSYKDKGPHKFTHACLSKRRAKIIRQGYNSQQVHLALWR